MVALSTIQAYVDEVARRFLPEKIVLFGSHANGKPTPDSDVDLLIVMNSDRDVVEQAVEIRRAVPRSFPIDILVRTPEELRWRLDEGDCFTRDLMNTGRVLYEAQHR